MTLRVTVEIVPYGDEDAKYPIHILDIFNKGMDGWGYAGYGIIRQDPENNTGGLYTSEVHHRRSDGALTLIAKAIQHMQAEEQKHEEASD